MDPKSDIDMPEDRMLVSILYADILGFSSMADILDPSQIRELLPVLWDRFDLIFKEHGGIIDKQLGDSLMAIWGAPDTLEDDAERAISASLELLKAINELKEKFKHPAAKALRLRLGIHTGLALAGNIGVRGEYTVR